MMHQNNKVKLNRSSKHVKALLRNQAIHFIKFGLLKTTTARVKAVRSLVEKVVTIAKKNGNHFNTIRALKKILPYGHGIAERLIKDIAPVFATRPGGYTRINKLMHRQSDTAKISMMTWVEEVDPMIAVYDKSKLAKVSNTTEK